MCLIPKGGAASGLRFVFRAPPLRQYRRVSQSLSDHHRAPSSPQQVLHTALRGVKYRGLAPDDPFGERSSWEDPSTGIYASWQHVDQDRFVDATESITVRSAHFGPEWARFATVGRLAARKMKADENAGKMVPTAEEAHERALAARRKLMEKSYPNYEAYVKAELCGETSSKEESAAADLHAVTAMEQSFELYDGVQGRDRMAQRHLGGNASALGDLDAAFVAADGVDLPAFMQSSEGGRSSSREHAVDEKSSAPLGRSDISTAFRTAVLSALPPPHGDSRLHPGDPEAWETEDILTFLTLFEDPTESVMDSTMQDTFRMARVDGKGLLSVTPPRLFQLLRRWHIRRQAVIRTVRVLCLKEWPLSEGDAGLREDNGIPEGVTLDDPEKIMSTIATSGTVEASIQRLQESVAPLNASLIQETILLCFQYGGH